MARRKGSKVGKVRYRTRTIVKKVRAKTKKGLAAIPKPDFGLAITVALAVFGGRMLREKMDWDIPYVSEEAVGFLLAAFFVKNESTKKALISIALAFVVVEVINDSGALDKLF